jgi:hypothetical protein
LALAISESTRDRTVPTTKTCKNLHPRRIFIANEASADGDHDGRPDRVVHILGNGEVICSTEDCNRDGKIDAWNHFKHGRIVEQATARCQLEPKEDDVPPFADAVANVRR